MDPSRGDSRYNLNYSMSSIGLSLSDQADLYGNPAAAAALGGRPPSGGLIQTMGGGGGGLGLSGRTSGGLMSNSPQCQSLSNTTPNSAGGPGQQQQQQQQQQQARGIKRTNSDCYDDHHRGGSGGGMSSQMQGLEGCTTGGNGQQGGGNVPDVVDDNYNSMQNKKSPPANGKKTKGRVKIKMEYIDNKLRRYTTFSKRKTGIMKKAYELSTLTGTQVMLLVASETGHVYTFATRKLQPMITSEAGKQLIQTCLNSPDPPSVGGGDQRMSATGFEETELSYNIADEDSKDDRSPASSANESDDSSDVDSPGPSTLRSQSQALAADVPQISKASMSTTMSTSVQPPATIVSKNPTLSHNLQTSLRSEISVNSVTNQSEADNNLKLQQRTAETAKSGPQPATGLSSAYNNAIYPTSTLSSIPQEVLLQLIQSGHLQLHTEEDGSGHQYITIPLSMPPSMPTVSSSTTANRSSDGYALNINTSAINDVLTKTISQGVLTTSSLQQPLSDAISGDLQIKQELVD